MNNEELKRLEEAKVKAYQEYLAARDRYKEAEQAWLKCLERRLFTCNPRQEAAK